MGLEIALRNSRELLSHYREKGSSHRGRPSNCDGAVFIWDLLDSPPKGHHELTRHSLSTSTPFVINFTEEERKKTCYISAAWYNERGMQGPWCDIESAIVP